jgi:Flp pilus assembly protein TadG
MSQQPASALERAYRKSDGSVLIEFTFLTPLLVALFLGTWQFGYAYFLYDKAEQAVRAGARYASERTYDSATSTPSAEFAQDVRNVVLFGDPAGGTTPVVPELAAANVKVEVSFFENGFASPPGHDMLVPTRVAVFIDGFSVGTLGRIPLTGKPRTEFPYVGVFKP